MGIWSRPLHLPYNLVRLNKSLPKLHIDFETRSVVDLRKTGAYRMCEDANTGVWCMAWGWYRHDIRIWYAGEPFPQECIDHVRAGGIVSGHNSAQFERLVWNIILVRRLGLVPVDAEMQPEQMDDTMVRAHTLALPASLDDLAKYLRLSEGKDEEGYKLMQKMRKPRKPRKAEDQNGIYWWDEPALIQRLGAYCIQDVVVEMAVDEHVAPLHADEHRIWCLDMRVNDRGVPVDVHAAGRAEVMIKGVKSRLDAQMQELTGGDFKCSQVAAIGGYLKGRGYDTEGGIAKDKARELALAAKANKDKVAVEVLQLRAEYAKSSTAKINAILNSACEDLRSRGNFQHHGASTGRWAGRLIQLQNLPRTKDQKRAEHLIRLFHDVRIDDADLLDVIQTVMPEAPMVEVSNALRAMVRTFGERTFVTRDFSNIEGRVNAWLANETWKLEAFKAYDTLLIDQWGMPIRDAKGKPKRLGPDLYLLSYAEAFGIPIEEVSEEQRQGGKVMELACGYQGSVGAFQNMAKVYGFKVDDERALELVKAWRRANARIVKTWWGYQDTAVAAVKKPGVRFPVEATGGKVAYKATNGFLYCQLPSRRVLAYARPRLVDGFDTFGRKRKEVHYEGHKLEKRGNSQARVWRDDIHLYGGIACENVVQAVARDLLVNALLNCEDRGWNPIMHVHDEIVLEVPRGFNSVSEVDAEMVALPPWAAGLPMAAEGWEGDKYRKG